MKQTLKLAALAAFVATALAFCAVPVMAQDQPAPAPAGVTFAVSTEAMALRSGGAWSAANQTIQAFNLMDFGKLKTNHVLLESHELIPASAAGFSIYAAGIGVQPDLTGLTKKTNLPPGNFGAEFYGALGNGIPSDGSGSHISALAGGVGSYRATSSLTWNAARFEWVRFGSLNSYAISMGLKYAFVK